MISLATPKEKVVLIFTPTIDFECDDMKSLYLKDELYFLREGNKPLALKVKQWLYERKITIVEENN